MYLPIGKDMAVRKAGIIGIFDMDNTSVSKHTRAFLNRAEKEGRVVPSDELPKSFILSTQYAMERVYLSPLSSRTLEKRMK